MSAQEQGSAPAARLQVEGLSVAFAGPPVIDGLDLAVGHGQIVSLIGPNGAGKTTVLNCISGFVQPRRGRILFAGKDLTRLPRHARAGLGIGRTFQNLQLFPTMTALENLLVAQHTRLRTGPLRDLLWAPAQHEEERARAHARAVLVRLGLAEVAAKPAAALSFGQQKLLGVARCLALGATLLLLDEPAAGLNHQEATALGDFIRSLRDWQGDHATAVLLVEHNMSLVMGVSDRVVVLDYGKKLADGTPEEVRRSPTVIAAYLGVGHAGGTG